jgi:hypothetical protein
VDPGATVNLDSLTPAILAGVSWSELELVCRGGRDAKRPPKRVVRLEISEMTTIKKADKNSLIR